ERQEAAGRPRPCPAVPGVMLRSKAGGPPAANRHSTGSYIARYLHGCPAERRGVPEGACAALVQQHGCGELPLP
ncbi:PLCH1 phosphodiesterase, partial [Zosterops hypoxanthus]|nr:PLCH1 phosphodiesterase [Zosterops hypoxanthus]